MVWSNILTLCGLAIPIGVAALTMSNSHLFLRFRTYMASKSSLLGKLAGCVYCLSHWLAFLTVLVFRPAPLVANHTPYLGPVAEFLATSFTLVLMSAPVSWFIFKAVSVIPAGGYEVTSVREKKPDGPSAAA